jgi:flagellar motor switch protein FliG
MAISGYEKAAVFLSVVGEEVAAEILKSLDVKEVGRISTHISRLQSMKQEEISDVFKEIEGEISKGAVHLGGEEYVKKMLSKGLGDESADKILELASKEDTIDALRWVDSKTLSNFLVTEHPQTIALVLCLLEPAQASDVLATFPDKLKADIAMRVAQTERLPKSAIEELNDVLKGQIDVGKGKGTKFVGTKAIAEILNRTDRSTEQMILENIETQNNILADSIRQLMFVFDDLVKLDDRGIQMILKEISTEDLSLALKTASDALKEKIFRNMSSRAAEILKEDMEVKGPVKVSDVSKAQQNIVRVTRKLEEEGKISIGGKGGEELV